MWLRERGFLEYLLLLHSTKETRKAQFVGVPRICELLRPVGPDNDNNGLNASRRRARGRVMTRPWTSGSGLALWSGCNSGSTEHRAGLATTHGEHPGPRACRQVVFYFS